MIVGERKPMGEILEMIAPHEKVLLLGCGTCVTVCLAGGEREVGILAAQLRIHAKKEGKDLQIEEHTIERQCENEWVDEIKSRVEGVDAVMSMACGVGVQLVAEMYPEKAILPALNTTFMGYPVQHGTWLENCRGCGNCVLHLSGGVCPITRCAKSLMNGPCGGSQDGKCEIDEDIECAWQVIYERLKSGGRLDWMNNYQPPRNWSTAGSGGPRKSVKIEEVVD
ncbi:MAG: methylenetetrahydrofolate reductase C-terminal domain-containing protein [Candidatus Thermoplasmatota archaeon]|nr:methylenetetrahydrofolate reductase C-terminal domain-containing protein [Candidatus Thermoplasmatota archaeon]